MHEVVLMAVSAAVIIVNSNRKVYHHNIFKGTKLANQFITYICSRNNLNNLYHERGEQRQTCVEY